MGRETRILLGLLGLLAGLFVGVLSLKLLVPRPPVGAGPDVHGDMAFTVRQELVPPPVRGPRAADFAAAPPLVATVPANDPFDTASPGRFAEVPTQPAGVTPDEPPASRFAAAPPTVDPDPLDPAAPTVDPFVQPAAFDAEESPLEERAAGGSRFSAPAYDQPGMAPEFGVSQTVGGPATARPASRFGADAWDDRPGQGAAEPEQPSVSADPFPAARLPADPATVQIPTDAIDAPPGAMPGTAHPFAALPTRMTTAPDAVPPPAVGPIAGGHVVAAGDSWWSLAERAYGDGRLYRALYAWNRARDPRVALVPGTSLEIPPVARLSASWPALVPAGR